MPRVIFVPQYPTPMRYQEWWWNKFPEEFAKEDLDVLILGAEHAEMMQYRRGTMSMFSPIHAAIELECAQIDEYMNLETKEDDILFLADISFPGFFSNVLFHKRVKRMFAFCHATSKNYKDYFAPLKNQKFPIETAHSQLFDAVFIGSDYHDDKLKWDNTLVTRLPYPPFEGVKINKKSFDIMSASRPNPQKVDALLERNVETRFGKIHRPETSTWFNYQWNLACSKILLITSFEDTFGYQIVDAVMNDCIPLAPNSCSYPELLSREYLYEDEEELMRKIDYILNGNMPEFGVVDVPKLLCHDEMTNFYKHIIEVLKGEIEPDYPF